jgi:hypothetical protein
MENEKLSNYFYAYAIGEIGLTVIGMFLLTRGINILIIIMLLQLLGQYLIYYEGIRSKRYGTYRIYMGIVVPFIFLSFMMWYNTF